MVACKVGAQWEYFRPLYALLETWPPIRYCWSLEAPYVVSTSFLSASTSSPYHLCPSYKLLSMFSSSRMFWVPSHIPQLESSPASSVVVVMWVPSFLETFGVLGTWVPSLFMSPEHLLILSFQIFHQLLQKPSQRYNNSLLWNFSISLDRKVSNVA